LFDIAHFQAVIGEIVNIKLSIPLNGRRKFKGPLVAIENNNLIIEVDSIDYEMPIGNVDKANLVAKL
jgi:ribosome maturation factor RimP